MTGGAGFIGSHLTEELVRRGERVRVVDDLSTGRQENLAQVPQVEFIEGDLADLKLARRAVAGVDFVLHQAAIAAVPPFDSSPTDLNGRSLFSWRGASPRRLQKPRAWRRPKVHS